MEHASDSPPPILSAPFNHGYPDVSSFKLSRANSVHGLEIPAAPFAPPRAKPSLRAVARAAKAARYVHWKQQQQTSQLLQKREVEKKGDYDIHHHDLHKFIAVVSQASFNVNKQQQQKDPAGSTSCGITRSLSQNTSKPLSSHPSENSGSEILSAEVGTLNLGGKQMIENTIYGGR
jgi:hypothetical protein